MAFTTTNWILVTILSVMVAPLVEGVQQVPCAFFFGDSLFDNGNNNLLLTMAKANYPPYGTDFLGSIPTGRFSNGRNIPDFLAEFLGFSEPIPPFATVIGSQILNGVNYASGAAGIRSETAERLGDRISMDRQLLNHKTTITRITTLLKSPNAAQLHLNKCLYTVNMGTNDYLNNYLMPQNYPTSLLYTPEQFAEALILQYSKQLTELYNDGARKVAVYGIGLIGCVPQILSKLPTNGAPCVDSVNSEVQLFNDKLKPLIVYLNSRLPGAKFTYINTVSISSGDPAAIGITILNMPCCIVNPEDGQCVPNTVPCANRDQHEFWDNIHHTEKADLASATRAYKALLPSDAEPLDIQRLVLLP